MSTSFASKIFSPASALLIAGALIAPATEANAKSTYGLDYTTADYSGVGPNGGTIIAAMVLTSGSALPGLGASFNVSFTLSPITSLYATHVWDSDNPANVGLSYGYPTANLYASLPTENQRTLEQTIDNVWYFDDLQPWMELTHAAGGFVYTDSFTITSSFLPTTPDGYFLSSETINYGTNQNSTYDDDEGLLYGGMFSYTHNPVAAFGDVSLYEWFTFNSGDHEAPGPHKDGPIFMIDASVSYEAVPEPSTVALAVLIGGAVLVHLRRKRG